MPAPPACHGAGGRPCIALTFDYASSETTTDTVLNIPAETQTKATFFMIGENMAHHPAAGHEPGNHPYSHPRFLPHPFCGDARRGKREAQPHIIDGLHTQGYVLVTVGGLLTL